MIILNVLLQSEENAIKIAEFVRQRRFALKTHVDTNTIIYSNGTEKSVRLFFLTRSLLYSEIEAAIMQHFGGQQPEIYAEPVSHLNEALGEELRAGLVQPKQD
ncbi:MAG: hypothetical protein EBU33_05265 [Sphingobacteriia bacterium]|jgi:hypothetical protein|nr:hypothetical protein [Sphingobacteriia bacterium]